MSDLILSVDVGGTNLRLGLVQSDMSIEAFDIVRSAPVLETDTPLDALIAILQSFLRRHGGTNDPGGSTLRAIAVGFPSTVDVTRRVVLSTANIAALQNLAVVDVLESAFRVPVVIDRDVNFLLRHDIQDLGLSGLPVVVGCYLGTGLGNAIAIGGEILVGAHGVAGELGHIPVRGLQNACGCGNIGCVEKIASGIRLTEIAGEHFGGDLDTLFTRHRNAPPILQFLDDVALPIASEINVLDPNVVVLGGGVIGMTDFPKSYLEARILERVRRPLPHAEVTFRYSAGGQLAGVLGGAISATASTRTTFDQIPTLT